MENYKSLDACRYFISSWAQIIKHVTRKSIFIAKCEVRPSYRTSDNSHVPWITLSATASVVAGFVWLVKNTKRSLNYILENKIKDYSLYYIFLQCDNIIDFLYFPALGDMFSCCCYALQN